MAHSSANLTKDTQQTLLLSNKHVYSCYQKTSKRPYLFSPPHSPKDLSWLYSNTQKNKLSTGKAARKRENRGG